MSERFYVEGGKQLHGEIEVSGAKNAALKFVAAALLSSSLAQYAPSPDAKLLAYAIAVGGADWETLRVRSVANMATVSLFMMSMSIG